jgi:hypothetical protein
MWRKNWLVQHKTYSRRITKASDLALNQIYIFGSNTEGRHSKGSALIARIEFGAKYGQASGMQGRSYAIITKDLRKAIHPSISPEIIKRQIQHLYSIAADDDNEYVIAYTGTGINLNGYSPKEMAAMFAAFPIPANFVFETEFYKLIVEYENERRNIESNS